MISNNGIFYIAFLGANMAFSIHYDEQREAELDRKNNQQSKEESE